MTIYGELNPGARALLHRPTDPAGMRKAAVELHERGLTPRDISIALELSEAAVHALLSGLDATSQPGGARP